MELNIHDQIPQNNNVILLIGAQRTGSNYMLSALKSFEGISVYGELFHRNGPYPFQSEPRADEIWRWKILRHFATSREQLVAKLDQKQQRKIASLLGRVDPGNPPTEGGDLEVRNQLLNRISHTMPFAYVSCVRELAEEKTIIFKAFPEHLATRELHALIKSLRPVIVFNIRDTMDMFLSFQKLKKLRLPQGEDTTSTEVRFDVLDYVEYLVETRSFYFAARDIANFYNLEHHVISYDDIHRFDTDLEKVRYISGQMTEWTGRDWTVNEDKIQTFRRQDQSKTYADKVENPDELPDRPASIFYA